MKTKFFTKNSKGKVEFTEKELKKLLDEIYNEGYRDGRASKTYTYTTPWYPYYTNTPYYTWTTTATSTGDNTITVNGGEYSSNTICSTADTAATTISSTAINNDKNKVKWTKSVKYNTPKE